MIFSQETYFCSAPSNANFSLVWLISSLSQSLGRNLVVDFFTKANMYLKPIKQRHAGYITEAERAKFLKGAQIKGIH